MSRAVITVPGPARARAFRGTIFSSSLLFFTKIGEVQLWPVHLTEIPLQTFTKLKLVNSATQRIEFAHAAPHFLNKGPPSTVTIQGEPASRPGH